jgi:hypothetical protein
MSWAQLLASYPGGLPALARDAGVAYTTLLRIKDRAGKRTPYDALRRLAACSGWAKHAMVPTPADLALLRGVDTPEHQDQDRRWLYLCRHYEANGSAAAAKLKGATDD